MPIEFEPRKNFLFQRLERGGTSPVDWYLKKSSGEEYGPADLETLRAWAAEGRVAAEDQVSRNHRQWIPAADEVLLEIEWVIAETEGTPAVPFHLGVLAERVHAGVLAPETVVQNARTGRTATLAQLMGLPEEPLQPKDSGVAPTSEDSRAVGLPQTTDWQSIARERDRLADESRKWRALHDELAATLRHRETEYKAKVRTLETEVIRLQNTLEHERQELAALRDDRETMVSMADESGDWSAAYYALAASYRVLTEELEAKAREVQALREELARLHETAEDRVRRADALAAQERRCADDARRAMAELERAHHEVIRSLRELNERYIRLRERQSKPSEQGPAETPSAGSATAGNPSSGPRIRLIR